MSVRQVVRLRVVEKKSRALSLQRLGSAFFICQIFSSQSRTAGQTSVSFRRGSSSPALRGEKKFVKVFFFQSSREGPTSLTFPCSRQVSVQRRSTQPECISSQANVLWLFYLPKFCETSSCGRVPALFRLVAKTNQSVKKNIGCQQHPVFPGGHPSKY